MTRSTVQRKSTSPAKILGLLVLIILLLVMAAIFLLPKLAGRLIEISLAREVGVPVKVGKLDFSLTQPRFSIKELRLLNPSGFPSGEMARVREAKVTYLPPATLTSFIDLKNLELEFDEVRLLRNEKGILNLPAPTSGPGLREAIDELTLTLASVTYTNLADAEPLQETVELGLDRELYRNVKGVAGIVEIVNWEILKRAGIAEEPEPAPARVTPTAESPAAVQTEPEPAPEAPPESGQLQLSPSLVPSVPEADESS